MLEKVLMKGNEAIGEAAIAAGCRYYFGYPITPQSELIEYMAKRLPEVGGMFLQAESEVAAINMVYGAAGAGARVMTSSSSPGVSLKQEGISYIAAGELPCVIVNIMRGGRQVHVTVGHRRLSRAPAAGQRQRGPAESRCRPVDTGWSCCPAMGSRPGTTATRPPRRR